ncbi:interleukin-20 receptor subunit alpha-like isoform X2 [Phyllobates terribilis]|uniref:interleukin-20 receptor subunit alpha-like isoform X2 n=1 Tax=Phyllobates terribilis TaxID=111132 RepID=UPI003CCA76E3
MVHYASPPPANDSCDLEVRFSSKNFKNILTWSTPIKKGVRYNVMYKRYGSDPWYEKAECTNITHNWCDLTNETSSKSEDYYGKVVINNQGCNISRQTDRFNPLIDTVLDPPKVNLFLTNTSLTINLTHIAGDLSSIYDSDISYELAIPGHNNFGCDERPYCEKKLLDLQTNICVSAKLRSPKESNFSNYTCIRTKTDLTSEERIHIMLYILSASLVIFVVFGAGYGVHKYIYVDNLEKPQILNITSNYNNNVAFVDTYNVTINVINIESSKSNEKSNMMADKEEKTQVKTDLYFKDGGFDTSHDSQVTEDDDHGYVSLLVQAPVTRTQVSPYDMPHNLVPKTSTVSTVAVNKEEDLYGRIKCNTIIASIQENTTEEAYQKSNMLEEPFTYLPKNDENFIKPDLVNNETNEIEESTIGQAADGTDFSDCDTLFVDWSPTSHHLYIPNFHSKAADEVGTEECQEVEGLLAHLYKPSQIEENSAELTCLEQKWGLHVKMQE